MLNVVLREVEMIRVFPRRTRWTPDDPLAIVGDPTIGILTRVHHLTPIRISVTFTWDIPEAERLYRSWSRFYPDVQLGGPAFDDPGGEFVPGRFVKRGITITSRGCGGSCGFCLVPKREGEIRELEIHDGWDVADNNLLACSESHVMKVFDMLKRQPDPVKFSGGLDARLFQAWHADLLRTIRLKFAWFACDSPGGLVHLERVGELLSDISIEKKRCYVLIGFDGEPMRQAEKRLEAVYRLGFLPMAMLYRPPEISEGWSKDWRALQRKWSRPAAYRKTVRENVQQAV